MNFFHRIPVHFCNIFYPCKIYGKENVPKGGAVIVCNHFRAIDCAFIADIYGKDIYFLAKKELFKNKFIARLIKSYGGIPIDRDKPDLNSIKSALRALKDGHKLAVFPEGTRNKTGTNVLQPVKGGSLMFALKARCPIVPVMISGKAKFMRRTFVIVGKPFELNEFYDKRIGENDYEKMSYILAEKMTEQQNILGGILEDKKRKKKKVKGNGDN